MTAKTRKEDEKSRSDRSTEIGGEERKEKRKIIEAEIAEVGYDEEMRDYVNQWVMRVEEETGCKIEKTRRKQTIERLVEKTKQGGSNRVEVGKTKRGLIFRTMEETEEEKMERDKESQQRQEQERKDN